MFKRRKMRDWAKKSAGLLVCGAVALLGLNALAEARAEGAASGPITWVQACGLPQKTQDYLLRDILLIAQAYRVLFGYRFSSDFRMGIRFFCTPAAFNGFLAQYVPDALNSGVIGMFIPQIHLMLIDARSTDDPAATLLHETSHAMLESTHGNYHVWLHEGLAESFETMDRQSRALTLPPNAYNRQALEYLLAEKPNLLNLTYFLGLDDANWRKNDRNIIVGPRKALNYARAMAWGLTNFLLQKPAGQQALNRLILNSRADSPQSDLQILSASWPGGLAQLQSDWLAWIRQPAQKLTFSTIQM